MTTARAVARDVIADQALIVRFAVTVSLSAWVGGVIAHPIGYALATFFAALL